MKNIIPTLSKMWSKVINLETTLFPLLKEELRKNGSTKQERTRSHALLLLNNGKNKNEVAEIINVSNKTVYNWIEVVKLLFSCVLLDLMKCIFNAKPLDLFYFYFGLKFIVYNYGKGTQK